MIGTKFYKPRPAPDPDYVNAAIWCNQNNATIEDKGEYYEVVAIPEPSLDEVKASKLQEIVSCWNVDDEKPVTVEGLGEFECDMLSRSRINSAISAMSDSETRNWTLKTGETITVTKAQLQSVIAAWIARSDAYHTHYLDLKQQVADATTIAEVEAIKW